MAKIVGAFICLLIVVMDVMAGILGIEAEIEQNKVCHLFPKQKTLYLYFSFFYVVTQIFSTGQALKAMDIRV